MQLTLCFMSLATLDFTVATQADTGSVFVPFFTDDITPVWFEVMLSPWVNSQLSNCHNLVS